MTYNTDIFNTTHWKWYSTETWAVSQRWDCQKAMLVNLGGKRGQSVLGHPLMYLCLHVQSLPLIVGASSMVDLSMWFESQVITQWLTVSEKSRAPGVRELIPGRATYVRKGQHISIRISNVRSIPCNSEGLENEGKLNNSYILQQLID